MISFCSPSLEGFVQNLLNENEKHGCVNVVIVYESPKLAAAWVKLPFMEKTEYGATNFLGLHPIPFLRLVRPSKLPPFLEASVIGTNEPLRT